MSWNPLTWPGAAIDYVGDKVGDVAQAVTDDIYSKATPTEDVARWSGPAMLAQMSREDDFGDIRIGAATRASVTYERNGGHWDGTQEDNLDVPASLLGCRTTRRSV